MRRKLGKKKSRVGRRRIGKHSPQFSYGWPIRCLSTSRWRRQVTMLGRNSRQCTRRRASSRSSKHAARWSAQYARRIKTSRNSYDR
ncbi:hypothetical protein IEO21_09538 [Rhodonia placenta]|uniref:Uncharacterized protein n=1 Tax=Rhodonia placenta TaxID=104341 RepID=A0A8H7NU66_9APHY|nr:hypothetical protein IEO21_09538 [Postia placenta]